MTKLIGTFLLIFSAGVMGSEPALSKSQILEIAKVQSATYCHSGSLGEFGQCGKVGCTLDANFSNNTWNVIAISQYENRKGEPIPVAGAARIYVFSPSGKLLKELPGQ
jgi:hypothetical protein